MKKLFPDMLDRPEARSVITSAVYWFVCYILIPFVTTLLLIGSYEDVGIVAGFDIAYYALNFVVMVSIFYRYILDSFLMVQIQTRKFIIVALICAAVTSLLIVQTIFGGFILQQPMAFSVFPVTETSVITGSAVVVMRYPVLGMLCLVLLAPVTVSCMYYATVFAPICCRRPWLAYLVMALVLLLPRLFNIYWLGGVEYELWTYFLHLPIHMIACWSYQKTDTVWTPIAVLAVSNLVSGLAVLWMESLGLIWLT